MAIAGITIQTTAEAYGTVRERLCASKDVADTQETGVPGMLAAVIAVFFDMAAFPYASPDSYLDDDWRKTPDADRPHEADYPVAMYCRTLFIAACLRRVAMVAVFVLAVSLGL